MRVHSLDLRVSQAVGPGMLPYDASRMQDFPVSGLWIEQDGKGEARIGTDERELLVIRGTIADKVFSLMQRQDFLDPLHADSESHVPFPKNCYATAAWLMEDADDEHFVFAENKTDDRVSYEKEDLYFPFGVEWIPRKQENGEPRNGHAAVVLGKGSDGRLIAFEKLAYLKPFNLSFLDDLHRYYDRYRLLLDNEARKYVPRYYPNHLALSERSIYLGEHSEGRR